MATGILRIRDGWPAKQKMPMQHSAIVLFPDGKKMELPEYRYTAAEHSPTFDNLPWKGE